MTEANIAEKIKAIWFGPEVALSENTITFIDNKPINKTIGDRAQKILTFFITKFNKFTVEFFSW